MEINKITKIISEENVGSGIFNNYCLASNEVILKLIKLKKLKIERNPR